MAVYNVHGGHNTIVPGASGKFSEVTEDRKVKDKVITLLRQEGHTVYDCTDDVGKTQSQNLSNIVKKCNAHTVDLDISIHFNAFNGIANGVEVLQYDDKTKEIAQRICNCIAKLGFQNRGVKERQDLYVLKNTKAKAILVECCFCDSEQDAKIYATDTMAKAIVEGILGESVSDTGTSTNAPAQPNSNPDPAPAKKELGPVDCCYAAYTDRWWPEVKNKEDWAGQGDNKPIRYLGLIVTKGSVKGRVYTEKNGWLPYLTFTNSYNKNDLENGVLGDGSPIQAVELYYYTPEGYLYKKIHYRVSSKDNPNFYPEQVDNEKGSNMDGYAGVIGKYADKFQAWIE